MEEIADLGKLYLEGDSGKSMELARQWARDRCEEAEIGEEIMVSTLWSCEICICLNF